MRNADVLDTQGILRLIESIPNNTKKIKLLFMCCIFFLVSIY